MLSTNQIAGFFDQQYIRKESIDIVDFLHEDNHQGTAASKTATFGSMWLVKPLIQSDCRIFRKAISLEGINRYLKLFVWKYSK